MIDRKNRYGLTAARIHDADGRARRPSSPTIDIHAHIVVPEAAKVACRMSTLAEFLWLISRMVRRKKSTLGRKKTSGK